MTENELRQKKKVELEEICKQKSLPRYKNRKELTKEELIQSILKAEEICTESTNENAQSEEKIERTSHGSETKVKGTLGDKINYIESVEPGTIFAFYDNDGIPNSAALVARSVSKRKLKLVTQYGKEFIIPYENVIWVRTQKMWPNSVYRLLKNRFRRTQDETR